MMENIKEAIKEIRGSWLLPLLGVVAMALDIHYGGNIQKKAIQATIVCIVFFLWIHIGFLLWSNIFFVTMKLIFTSIILWIILKKIS